MFDNVVGRLAVVPFFSAAQPERSLEKIKHLLVSSVNYCNFQERTLTLNNDVTTKFLNPAESSACAKKERERLMKMEEEGQLQAALQSSAAEKDQPMETDQH